MQLEKYDKHREMRIVFIDKVGNKAGMDLYSNELCGALIKLGASRTKVFTSDRNRSKKKFVRAAYGGILSEKSNAVSNLFWNIIGLIRVLRETDKENYIVLHIHNFDLVTFFDSKILRFFSRRIVLMLHDYDSISDRKSFIGIRAIMIRQAYRVFVHNELVKEIVEKKHCVEAVHIKHGVAMAKGNLLGISDAKAALGVPNEHRVFLFFGQVKSTKGLDTFLKAVAELDCTEGITVIVAGRISNSLRKEYHHYIQQAKRVLKDSLIIEFDYITDSKRDLYFRASDYVVLPYKVVNQSGVFLMALSYGKTPICSDAQGLQQYLADFEFVPSFKSDNHMELADIMVKLASETRCDNSALDIQKALEEKYSWEHAAQGILSSLE